MDAEHWDGRYRSFGVAAVSWFQQRPGVSLELLDLLGVSVTDGVVDVGGGASTLVDHLLERGVSDVTVLDLSQVALDAARVRTGNPAGVAWVQHDLLTWRPTRRWDVWHDRAMLHFLTRDEDRATYLALLRSSLVDRGSFVIGTFAEAGPTECSALPVHRHSLDDLEVMLKDCDIVDRRRELHRTPTGVEQPFNWIAGRMRAT